MRKLKVILYNKFILILFSLINILTSLITILTFATNWIHPISEEIIEKFFWGFDDIFINKFLKPRGQRRVF